MYPNKEAIYLHLDKYLAYDQITEIINLETILICSKQISPLTSNNICETKNFCFGMDTEIGKIRK